MTGAAWTPLRYVTITNQTDALIPAAPQTQSKYFGGVVITAGAAATTVIIRDGTSGAGAEVTRYVVALGTTQAFPNPGMLIFQTGIYADVDANTVSLTVMYG
jgi:hypothetical protein